LKEFLVSKGGQIYVPHQPKHVMLTAPAAGTRYEIVYETDWRKYDQATQVSRKTAESLVRSAPDMWAIERV